MYKPVKRSNGRGSAQPQRLFQIMTCLFDHDDLDTDGGWMTSGNVARCIGLTTSPHFRALMDILLARGYVEVREKPWRKNMVAYEWRLTESAFHGEFQGAWDAYWGTALGDQP